MKARFSLVDIACIKRELASLLPNVKSSHRTEAMARGFGWQTNAALRAALAGESMDRAIDDHAFTSYLERRTGKWLQSGGQPTCSFRRALLPVIARSEMEPEGYLREGRVMM